MATTIELKNSVTTGNSPSSLAQGETAWNITDKKVWIGNASSTPIQLIGAGASMILNSLTASTLSSPAATALTLQSAGTTAITVDTSQNVGIGYIPSGTIEKLSVSTSSGSGIGFNTNSTYTNWVTAKIAPIDFGLNYTGGLAFYTNSGTTAGTAPTEKMRIDSSGKVFVNTTSALGFGGGIFNIKNNGDNAVQIECNSNNSGVSINQNTVGGTYLCVFGYRAGVVGSIQTNGTTTSYNITSDRRLKENILPFSGGLQTITALKPSQYNYISDKETTYQGFIADELQSVVPQAVTGKVNEVDAEGKPIYQGVDASFLIPHLVSAIQEQQALITDLTTRLSALEAK